MIIRKYVLAASALVVLSAACSGNAETTAVNAAPATTNAPTAAIGSDDPVVTTEPVETTAAPFTRLVELAAEAPAWEDVTFETADGVELYAKFWPGGDTAVLFGHDYSVTTAGAAGQRPPQSSDSILVYSGTIAREGYTVLSPDFRGHGQSGGEFRPQSGPDDLKAAYDFLTDRGYTRIVMVGWVGSGTTAVVLDASDEDVSFDGITMLFSPPQDHGMNADAALSDLETSIFFVGSNAGTSASWSRRMEAKALNSQGAFVFDRTPTGLQFSDVFGPEFIGRILDFVDGA